MPVEDWIIALFSATLVALYRIYEPEIPPTRRKATRIALIAAISGLLVPGIAKYFNVDNTFLIGLATGLTVYCFEPILKALKNKYLNKIDNGDI